MSLWAPHLLVAARWVVPTTVLVGSSATYLTALAAIRLLTLPFPEQYYWRGEQALYSAYQSVTGFLFETWSGVEVRTSIWKTINHGINSAGVNFLVLFLW